MTVPEQLFHFTRNVFGIDLSFIVLAKNLDGVIPFLTIHTVRYNPSDFLFYLIDPTDLPMVYGRAH